MGKLPSLRYFGCSVCGSLTTSNFYGVICCDACRTFFKRHILEYRAKDLVCYQQGFCEITLTQRKCTLCRLQKCLLVGMKADVVIDNEVIRNIGCRKIRYQIEMPEIKQSHEIRRILHFISQLPSIYDDVKHEYLEIKKIGSIDIAVVKFSVIDLVSFQITVEISLEEEVPDI